MNAIRRRADKLLSAYRAMTGKPLSKARRVDPSALQGVCRLGVLFCAPIGLP
jgi:hypothetical protein